jgi:hypothetical protein
MNNSSTDAPIYIGDDPSIRLTSYIKMISFYACPNGPPKFMGNGGIF